LTDPKVMKDKIEETKNIIKKEIVNIITEFGLELDKIILFGSRARGDFTKYSDWDFLIVVKNSIDISEKRKLAKAIRERLAEELIDVDIIVKTTEELDYYKDFIGTVTREALKEGIIV